MEYFCAAKPQSRDLKAVQGAKRLMLQRLVNYLMGSKTVEHVFLNQQLLAPDKKQQAQDYYIFSYWQEFKKNADFLADAYF